MAVEIDWTYTDRQNQALDILEEPLETLDLCYGGAKGGGKTVLGCRWVFRSLCKLIQQYKLKPSKYPPPLAFMGRKRGADFVKTTLETWKEQVPQSQYTINEQKHEIVVRGTVKIIFGGFDDRKDVEKFNSAEYVLVFIDQAEELTRDEISMVFATRRRKIKSGSKIHVPQYRGLLTANPRQCWLKNEFVKNPQALRQNSPVRFLQALPTDNKFLPASYISQLESSFKHRPELLAAYLHGSWDALEGADIIIKDMWVRDSHQKNSGVSSKRRLISVDVARFGDDRTVIGYGENTHMVEILSYGQRDTHYTSGLVAQMANKYQVDGVKPAIVIDADGIGGAVADNLIAWDKNQRVIQIHSASTANNAEKFGNLRAEMWWTAGEKYASGEVEDTYKGEFAEELDAELTVPTYHFRNGKIYVESKDDLKKPERYGKSPDLADMRIMYLYALDMVEPDNLTQSKRGFDRWSQPRKRSFMGV